METDVEWPESGSAILVFTCPPDYCTWQSLPPIAFRYLRHLSNLPVRLSLSEKGSILNCLHFVGRLRLPVVLMFLIGRRMEISIVIKQEVDYCFNE